MQTTTYVYDIETDGLGEPGAPPPRPLLAGIFDGRRFVYQWGPRSPWQVIRRACERHAGEHVQFWAHNGGGFDFRFVLPRLMKVARAAKFLIAGSMILQMDATLPDGTRVTLTDSMRLLPGKLADIGAALGMPKGEAKYTHDRECRQAPCLRCSVARGGKHRKAALDYWKQDLRILWAGLREAGAMLGRLGITTPRITLASNAAAYLELTGGKPDSPHWGDPRGDMDEAGERAYFGGRVEVHQEAPEGLVHTYDIHSSYPAAMAEGPIPWRYTRTIRGWQEGRLGTVVAEVEVPKECAVPVLPFRGKDGRIYWPTGRWVGAWTDEELRYAVEVGAARVVRAVSHSQWEGSDVCGDFARLVWAERSAAQGFARYFWKIFGNSAYGKLIEARDKEGYFWKPKTIEGYSQTEVDDLFSRPAYYQPKMRCSSAAAYITARGRIRLHKGMVGGGACYYVDTDSRYGGPMVDGVGDGLGEWGCEGVWDSGRFYAAKLYALKRGDEWKVKARGLPGIDGPGLEALLHGTPWEYVRTSGAKEFLKRGDWQYSRVAVSKRHIGQRPKRAPIRGGMSRPWTVGELKEKWKVDKTGILW